MKPQERRIARDRRRARRAVIAEQNDESVVLLAKFGQRGANFPQALLGGAQIRHRSYPRVSPRCETASDTSPALVSRRGHARRCRADTGKGLVVTGADELNGLLGELVGDVAFGRRLLAVAGTGRSRRKS